MTAIVTPSKINGILQAPSSKSSMQRACAAALLHFGTTHILNAGISNDDKAALNIIHLLGAEMVQQDNNINVVSNGFSAESVPLKNEISCGESGLSIRMFAPIAALSSSVITLTGSGSLLTRPMSFFDEIFPQLGVHIETNNGHLPLKINGPIQPVSISIDGSLSSQFLTGLLFSLGAAATEIITVYVNDLKSKPYIDLTLDVMKNFGYKIENENYERFVIHPKPAKQENIIEYTVEGDWSSTAFLLVAGAIGGNVKITGLDINSTQADKAIMQALKDCGASININDDCVEIAKAPLHSFTFDATDCPDLFPPLAALAAYCKGTTVIKGTHRLAAKESDRAKTLQQIFGEMGIEISLKKDEMFVRGGSVKTAEVSSHHDHRIAMAAAVAALGAEGTIEISNADAVNKSYPQFYEDLKKLGTTVDLIQP